MIVNGAQHTSFGSQLRYELKYVVKDLQKESAIYRFTSLFPHISFREVANYKVTSLYFDNHSLSCYRDHVEGLNRRHKYRLRWYDDNVKSLFLERKTKTYNVSSKIRCPVPSVLIRKPVHEMVQWLQSYPAMQTFKGFPLPTLMTQCTRRRFDSQELHWNYTIDEHLVFSNQRFASRIQPLIKSNNFIELIGQSILEFKIPLDPMANIGTQTMQKTNSESFSKYVYGIEKCLHPHI